MVELASKLHRLECTAIPSGSRMLMRVDFNVPLKDGLILDELRIDRTLPSIQRVLEQGAKLILATHLGRPERGWSAEFSLKPVAERLSALLGKPVRLVPENGDSLGRDPQEWSRGAVAALHNAVEQMQSGDVVLWENLRFHPGEQRNDRTFAESFADLIDVYCHDAFGAAQNRESSLVALPEVLRERGKPCVAGLLLVEELNSLGRLLDAPARPFVVVMGGAKVTDKSRTIANLLDRCDDLMIGGALAYPFLAAHGISVGKSKLDPKDIPLAQEILARAAKAGNRLHLPVDHWTVPLIEQPNGKPSPRLSGPRTLQRGAIVNDEAGIDIGPETARQFAAIFRQAATVFWNGPMGLFDKHPLFEFGTRAVAEAIVETQAVAKASSGDCFAVVGGGESASAVRQFGLDPEFSLVSTGGGASLRLLAGETFESVTLLSS